MRNGTSRYSRTPAPTLSVSCLGRRHHLRRADQRSGSAELDFLEGAAAEDVAEAQKLLGEKLLFGKGVPRDRRRAVELLESATSRNEPGAKELLYEAKSGGDPLTARRPRRGREEGAKANRHDLNDQNRKR